MTSQLLGRLPDLSLVFVMPETKGRTLEEMDVLFGEKRSNEDKEIIEGVRSKLGLSQNGSARRFGDEHESV